MSTFSLLSDNFFLRRNDMSAEGCLSSLVLEDKLGESSSKSFHEWPHLVLQMYFGIAKPSAAWNWKVLKAMTAYVCSWLYFALQEFVFLLCIHGLAWGWVAFFLQRCSIFGYDTSKLDQILNLSFQGNVVWFNCTQLCFSFRLLGVTLFPLSFWGAVAVYA